MHQMRCALSIVHVLHFGRISSADTIANGVDVAFPLAVADPLSALLLLHLVRNIARVDHFQVSLFALDLTVGLKLTGTEVDRNLSGLFVGRFLDAPLSHF